MIYTVAHNRQALPSSIGTMPIPQPCGITVVISVVHYTYRNVESECGMAVEWL